ncbi:ABC transporter permease [Paenibacillus baekrokdamisoli]|uniref:ABC transporter permease n=1 Tax=Paenibacillus baekrokdamisoli TaxID=1712516 RepID=A0A3G9IZ21_9BACL|nr:carbohydrate ABC transporter permease [Paenibacillus baekrokdamisoli]MBB3070404.1 ABC-type glycerol-3-phosphate transport system permease component [Paenibacillus baekrokdamisoli]BBH21405.1 ABC transporter permease [Paenibacillus baekrokdamisoli]
MAWLSRNMMSRLKRISISRSLLVICFIGLAIFMLLPIIFLFNNAFKPLNELFLFPPTIFVKEPTTHNFAQLFLHAGTAEIPFTRYLFNSIVIVGLSLVFVILISTMAGYVIAKHRFPFKTFVMAMIMLSLMFAPETVAIPRYLIVSHLGITNTYLAHILPFIASPVAVFLMKQFIDQIPDSLLEAAKLDGASDFYIFMRIIIPLTAPAVATVAIITFQAVYLDMEGSTLYTTKESMKTLAFYVSSLTANLQNSVAGQSMAAAAALLMFIPNLIMFLLFQRKMIQTMLHSGVK